MPDQNTLEEVQRKLDDTLKRVEKLEEWKAARESQQLTYPIDFVSQQIIAGI